MLEHGFCEVYCRQRALRYIYIAAFAAWHFRLLLSQLYNVSSRSRCFEYLLRVCFLETSVLLSNSSFFLSLLSPSCSTSSFFSHFSVLWCYEHKFFLPQNYWLLDLFVNLYFEPSRSIALRKSFLFCRFALIPFNSDFYHSIVWSIGHSHLENQLYCTKCKRMVEWL